MEFVCLFGGLLRFKLYRFNANKKRPNKIQYVLSR